MAGYELRARKPPVVRKLRVCTCPASKTRTGQIENWKLMKLHTGNGVWILRCLACGATWQSGARYVQGLQHIEDMKATASKRERKS